MSRSSGKPSSEFFTYFRNCDKETLHPVQGIVSGTIPQWLEGKLTRVGAGIKTVGKDNYTHVFDGLAVLHKFEICNGKAYYQSRALESDTYKKSMEANRIVVSEFGTHAYPDPCETFFGRLKADFTAVSKSIRKICSSEKVVEISDNCSVNVGYYGDQLYAMTESNCVWRIDPDTLATLGDKVKIDDYVRLIQATPHPHILSDGTAINVGSSARNSGPHYSVIRIPPSFDSEETSFKRATLIADIPARWKLTPAYFHSFGVTDSGKLIFIEQPFCIHLLKLAVGCMLNRPLSEFLKWHSGLKTRFYVISIEGGKLHPVVYETDNLFVFHHINAYEEDGHIIVDVSAYDDAKWVELISTNIGEMPQELSGNQSARRFVLPLNVEHCKAEINLIKLETSATAMLRKGTTNMVDVTPTYLTNELFEVPRINYKYNGKKYRYVYGLGNKNPGDSYLLTNKMIKLNVETGDKLVWLADEASLLTEPVFVANTTSLTKNEDDGVILAVMLPDSRPNDAILLILDAQNMLEIARVVFMAPGAVTTTFHGSWAQNGDKVHFY